MGSLNRMNRNQGRFGRFGDVIRAAMLCTAAAECPEATAEVFAIEGTITSIRTYPTGSTNPTVALVKCNGVEFAVNVNTPITSPSAALTLTQLADTNRIAAAGTGTATVGYQGLNPMYATTGTGGVAARRAGFTGGTCIANGDDAVTQPVNGVPYPLATDLFVEVSENVLIGRMTGAAVDTNAVAGSTGVRPKVLGVEVVIVTDPRMPGKIPTKGMWRVSTTAPNSRTLPALLAPTGTTAQREQSYQNGYGFGLTPQQVYAMATEPGAGAMAAVGFYGADGKFYAVEHEMFSAGPVGSTSGQIDTPRATLVKAVVRDSGGAGTDRIDALGGCRTGTTATSADFVPAVLINVWYEQATATGTRWVQIAGTPTVNPAVPGTSTLNTAQSPASVGATLSCTADPLEAPYGLWRLRISGFDLGGNGATGRMLVNQAGTALYDVIDSRYRGGVAPVANIITDPTIGD